MSALLLICLFVLMLIGIPIGFAIGLSSTIFLQVTGFRPLVLAVQRIFVGIDSFPLLAIPMFILAGYLMEDSGISRRLIAWVEILVGRVRGAMGAVTIVACTLFAALTGSGPATVSSIGSLMYPAMKKSGFSEETAAGIIASAGALGPIIPPSIPMIVFATTVGLSVGKMFIGAIVPGLMIAVFLIITMLVVTRKQELSVQGNKLTMKLFLHTTVDGIGALLAPVIVLGGIYGGVVTPTEAGTVCVVYSIILGLLYKELTLKKLMRAISRTVETSAQVLFIIGISNLFGWLLTATNLPNTIATAITSVVTSKYVFLLVLMLFLFVVGALMDTIASIIILAPILYPIGVAFGIDPLQMGLLFCINLIVGFITPPFGINLFCTVGVCQISYTQVVKGVLPFIIAEVIAVALITFIPGISLFLPGILGA